MTDSAKPASPQRTTATAQTRHRFGLGAVALIGVASFATSCAINPLTGKRELALVPESQEVAMGKQAAEEVGATMGFVDNAELQKYVSDIGMALAAKSERPDLPWSFKVVDDPVVNAFALPGGPIFITRGLLTHMGSEAQLAAVMGHEIGHVTGRHAVRQMSKALVAQGALVVGMAVSDTVAGLGELGMGGLQLLFLRYGRDAEREADDLGYRYSVNTGYDVRAMPAVFATLKRVSEASGGDRLPSWMASHPSPDERIERINKQLATTAPPPGKVERDRFLAVTNGLVYGPDPRQGYFEGQTFKHPQMRFQIAVPPGWKKQNMAQALVAQSADGKGQFQLTMAKGSPSDALQQFQGNKAVTNLERIDMPMNVPGTAARFVATTEGGPANGLIAFVAHEGKTFQMLGLGEAATFAAHEPAVRASQSSFAPLTDAAAMNVQPARVKLITVPSAMTLGDLAKSHTNLPAERLAILNQLEVSSRLEAGQKIKVIEGQVKAEGS